MQLKNLRLSFRSRIPGDNLKVLLQDEKNDSSVFENMGRTPHISTNQACSGSIRLEQCKCRQVEEREGGTIVIWKGTG